MARVDATMAVTERRLIGVDIAKIVAMLFVVARHVNGFGLPYAGECDPGAGYLILRSFLTAIFSSCIDIFAIASGYVGIFSKFRLSRIIRLWLQVVVTGLAVLLFVDCFLKNPVPLKAYVKACVPVAQNQYWYMTGYFMLCFVMPLINSAMRTMDRKIVERFLALVLGVIGVESFCGMSCTLGINAGYSFEWLLVLYVVGAYLRLYDPLKVSRRCLLSIAAGAAMAGAWIPLALGSIHSLSFSRLVKSLHFTGYTTPFTVVIALCVFLCCAKTRIESVRLTRFVLALSSTTLGVYLIHTQRHFFYTIFVREVEKLAVSDGGQYLVKLSMVSVVTFLVCVVLDYIRLVMFKVVGMSACAAILKRKSWRQRKEE